MRGKKSDPAFVTAFIQESAMLGLDNPAAIADRAKKRIAEIDEQIRKVEDLKIERSKLLDVILQFDKPVKDRSEEAKLLTFFQIEYPEICKEICERVKKSPFKLTDKFNLNYNYSIQQLLERKVLAMIGNQLIRGDKFEDYMKLVLREGQ
jgi:hypothetical protein